MLNLIPCWESFIKSAEEQIRSEVHFSLCSSLSFGLFTVCAMFNKLDLSSLRRDWNQGKALPKVRLCNDYGLKTEAAY